MLVGSSTVRPRAIEAAIRIFGSRGYAGVNMRDLAKAAKTTPASIYRLFGNKKEDIYKVAVTTARDRALDAVALSVFVLVDHTDEDDAVAVIGRAMRVWYNGFGQAEARLLLQVEIADSRYRKLARGPFEKMANHLATALQKAQTGTKKGDMQDVAKILLSALFFLKVSEHESERQQIDDIVNQLVLLVGF
jgi:AcrR family transcriptional regulator